MVSNSYLLNPESVMAKLEQILNSTTGPIMNFIGLG